MNQTKCIFFQYVKEHFLLEEEFAENSGFEPFVFLICISECSSIELFLLLCQFIASLPL